MPLVREFVAELFGREPNTSHNPDEAVALGATIQAGILSGAVRNVVLLDVTPLSLGIETLGGLMNVIIPRNTTIPVKAGEAFTTAVDHQREMLIHVLDVDVHQRGHVAEFLRILVFWAGATQHEDFTFR